MIDGHRDPGMRTAMAKKSDVAVIAHQRKVLGGGLDELRKLLTDEISES